VQCFELLIETAATIVERHLRYVEVVLSRSDAKSERQAAAAQRGEGGRLLG
jgi:hypothetical protein